MSNIKQATPMLHVPNFDSALDFFIRVLGFTLPFRMTNYAYFVREGANVRVLEEIGRKPVDPKHSRMTVYIDVENVDALFAELKPRLDLLPQGDVQPPTNQHYGQRELHVRMPDGHWLAFGQEIPSNLEHQ